MPAHFDMEIELLMPFIITGARRGGRGLAAAIGLMAAMAGPAHAGGNVANPYDCQPGGPFSTTFSAWNDNGLYTPIANAGFERGSEDWTLSGDAEVVPENEPWKVGGDTHENSLRLTAGSSALSAPICVDETYTHFRLFARKLHDTKTSLKIDVLVYNRAGNVVATKPYNDISTSTSWQPTDAVPISVFNAGTSVESAPVAFRFTAQGQRATYQIDDVYVDPWARG